MNDETITITSSEGYRPRRSVRNKACREAMAGGHGMPSYMTGLVYMVVFTNARYCDALLYFRNRMTFSLD